jgi:very-short-patch-repair endonuclease
MHAVRATGPDSRDAEIARLASRHNRVVTRPQLVAAGLTRSAIAHRIAKHRLHRVHPGVYLLDEPGTASRITLFTAAVYACGAQALLSHQSAAELWEFAPDGGADIDVTVVARNPGTRRAGVRIHRPLVLDRRDVRVRRGVSVTSPARTALDIAMTASAPDLERLLATARVKRVLTDRDLVEVLARYPVHRACARLTAVLNRAGGPAFTRSDAERLMLSLMRRGRLPAPQVNARVHGFEVDFLWPDQRLIVEVDGFAYHGDRDAFERDRDRDAALVAAGFRVIRVTWRKLVEEPLLVLARVARALGT